MNKGANGQNPEKLSSKFLERFEGRTSTIGKAGLLSLLEENMPKLAPRVSGEGNKKLEGYLDLKLESKKSEEQVRMGAKALGMPIANSSRYSQIERDRRASHQSFRSEMGRKNSNEQVLINNSRNSVPRLPQINRQAGYGVGFHLQSSMQLKPGNKQSLIKSRESAQHLQFLDLFEQRLKRAGHH